MTIFWIALILVAIILILKFRGKGKRVCGPGCQPLQKPTSLKTKKDYKKEKEEIKKKIERQKGRDPKDLDLFKDFMEEKK